MPDVNAKPEDILKELTPALLAWFEENARVLPWREDPTPYHVWISEIMLQQTRVEAVKPYYERFTAQLPTLRDLAACPEDKLLKLWEGLGYYSRVRNLQKAARQLTEASNKRAEADVALPADPERLISLPGIGSYTAGAVASIAFGLPVPAVDGNVMRVLSRILMSPEDISLPGTKKQMERLLSDVIPPDSPGAFNQALMELGALVCLPNGTPLCGRCPVKGWCRANAHSAEDRFPVRKGKRERRIQEKTVLVITDGIRTMLHKRPSKGLLAGMYEFPCVDGHITGKEALSHAQCLGAEPVKIKPLPDSQHIFTHIQWKMKGYSILAEELGDSFGREYPVVTRRQAEEDYPIPSAFTAYLPYFP